MLSRGPCRGDPRRQRDSGQPGSEPGAEAHKAGARQRSAGVTAKENTPFGEAVVAGKASSRVEAEGMDHLNWFSVRGNIWFGTQ